MASAENVYSVFINYYGDLTLRMIKNESGWAVYATRVYSGLNSYRYIFVVVPVVGQYPANVQLSQLDWVSFQTRTTEELHDTPTTHLSLDENRKQILSDKITVISRDTNQTEYITNRLPIKIRLIHEQKKKNHLQYPDSATLYQALETYQCVIDLL